MNEEFLEILKTLVTKVEAGTDLLIGELIRFYLVSGLLKMAMVAAITMFISRLLGSGLRVLHETGKAGDQVDMFYKGLLRTAQVGVLVGAILYSYTDLMLLVKVGTAPHIFFLEMVKNLTGK